MSEKVTLKDVVDRLDLLIALFKLANKDTILEVKKEIEKDPVLKKLLELADGSKEYTALAEEVAKATGKHVRTVKAKISKLAELGALRGIRRGRKVYYQNTGLYD